MSTGNLALDPVLHSYAIAHGNGNHNPLLTELIAETQDLLGDLAKLKQISIDQATFMTLLCRLMGVRRAVEVGTFTGLSSLAMALGMQPDGHLLCCDISEEWTAVAKRYWERAGVADRIELVIAPAQQTLAALPKTAELDLAFIDANKGGYVTYWNELVPRMRPGGLLLVDNVLWYGRVVDSSDTDPDTVAIREFNQLAAADKRVESVILSIGDGLLLARVL